MVQEQQRLLCRGRLSNSWGGREGPPGQMLPLKRQQDYYALSGVKAAEAVHGRGMPEGVEVAVAVAAAVAAAVAVGSGLVACNESRTLDFEL